MRIGIDIDNTIICYDHAFRTLAKRTGFDGPQRNTKQDVKRWFHERGMYDEFTILQGQVYGTFISLAHIFDGVDFFVNAAIKQRHELFLVSHKTKFPIKGDQVDLHKAAIQFLIEKNLVSQSRQNTISTSNVYFEPTVEAKVERIATLKLDYFIDDLLPVLEHEKFPASTCSIWFANEESGPTNLQALYYDSWASINDKIFDAR